MNNIEKCTGTVEEISINPYIKDCIDRKETFDMIDLGGVEFNNKLFKRHMLSLRSSERKVMSEAWRGMKYLALIVECEEWKADFPNQTTFAEFIGKSDAYITQVKKLAKFDWTRLKLGTEDGYRISPTAAFELTRLSEDDAARLLGEMDYSGEQMTQKNVRNLVKEYTKAAAIIDKDARAEEEKKEAEERAEALAEERDSLINYADTTNYSLLVSDGEVAWTADALLTDEEANRLGQLIMRELKEMGIRME